MSEATPPVNASASQLSQYIERIERIEEEKKPFWLIYVTYNQKLTQPDLSQKLCAKLLKCVGSTKMVAEQDILLSTYECCCWTN